MKRAGNLMLLIAAPENLREAFLLVVRGKQLKHECLCFRHHMDEEIAQLHRQLLDGSYRMGDYRRFKVFDPKERTICAVPFRDRLVMHAMMRVCHNLFESYQMDLIYASRRGRGTYKAIEQARRYSGQYEWFLKLDVCKFFDSISHDCLKQQLRRLVKDRLLLAYWDMIIDSYKTTPGCGLPIGNLTSQYWANHYLAVADHWVKERLHAGPMVRYMDDVVMWGSCKTELSTQAKAYTAFVAQELRLQLHVPVMNRTRMGMPFLGYVVRPCGLSLTQRSRHRYRHKIKRLAVMTEEGIVSQEHCLLSVQSMRAFINKANRYGL